MNKRNELPVSHMPELGHLSCTRCAAASRGTREKAEPSVFMELAVPLASSTPSVFKYHSLGIDRDGYLRLREEVQ